VAQHEPILITRHVKQTNIARSAMSVYRTRIEVILSVLYRGRKSFNIASSVQRYVATLGHMFNSRERKLRDVVLGNIILYIQAKVR
jgi:hypothetical protein